VDKVGRVLVVVVVLLLLLQQQRIWRSSALVIFVWQV
jgi:hypothetical protein